MKALSSRGVKVLTRMLAIEAFALALQDVARHALGKELHRQAQDLPHERTAADNGHFPVDFESVDVLYPCRRDLGNAEDGQQTDKGQEQLPVLPGQQAVHEKAGEDGIDDAEEIADRGGEQHKNHRRPRSGKSPAGKFQRAFRLAAGHEALARFDLEDDAGEGAVKLLHRDFDFPAGRIVEIGIAAPEAVENHKVIEIPVDDAGEAHFLPHGVDFAAISLGVKAVAPRRGQHVPCVGAVAGDAAVETDLFQRHPLAIVGHHHGQGSGTAFERLHLHDDRDFGSAAAHRFFDILLLHGGPSAEQET